MLAFAAALQKKAFAGVLQGTRRMTRAASRDPLTGLPNRRELDRRLLELAVGGNAGLPVTALFLDLDGFKSINDTLGHATGDSLLRDVSRALRDATRAGDIIARVGGDEFIVVAPDLPPKKGRSVVGSRIASENMGFVSRPETLRAQVPACRRNREYRPCRAPEPATRRPSSKPPAATPVRNAASPRPG